MSEQNLLVELFVEELPPKSLKALGEAFATLLSASLKAQGLVAAEAAVTPFATPRRLAVHVAAVAHKAADKNQRVKLMPVAVALDASGQPTPALLKKLGSLGVDAGLLPQLQRVLDGKTEALFLDSAVPGATLTDGLQKALSEAISKLPIPKVMQYPLQQGSGPGFQAGWTSVNFVRPAHGLVALWGDTVVDVTVLGLRSGRTTQGHRFEARVPLIHLRHADSYAEQLRDEGAVIASFAERRADIVQQLDRAASAQGLKPIQDDALLDEVTGLVERPNVLRCVFEPEFLDVPAACLILTMKVNQKYFPLLDAQGQLTAQFLIVSNISPADPSRVIEGNQRVVRPRLADAKFFFDQDRKKTLASRVPLLDRVVYHGKLGSQGQRVQRVRAIAASISAQLHEDGAMADRAALLAKADLLTDMVGEFPELQGVMGGTYARHDGEPEALAEAIEDHYKPRFAGDALPRCSTGVVLALADKLETLAGLFGIGQLPTGDKDPFALRRHALGVVRLLVERDLPLSVGALLAAAFKAFPADHGQAQAEVAHFVFERLMGYLRDLGYTAHEVEAVLALRPERLSEMPKRLAAVRAFAALPEAPALAAANKRVGNILKKSEASAQPVLDELLLVEPAERALADALAQAAPRAAAAFAAGDYGACLSALAVLKTPVDAFFEAVMVNAEDPHLRRNRLALLAQLHAAMNRVADLSLLSH